jgi:hypothetical protein
VGLRAEYGFLLQDRSDDGSILIAGEYIRPEDTREEAERKLDGINGAVRERILYLRDKESEMIELCKSGPQKRC